MSGDYMGKAEWEDEARAAISEDDWRDDPSDDERWNAGCDFAMTQLCAFLGVDPASVSWDAATETLDGDVQSVIGNILRAHFGEEWGPQDRAPDLAAENERLRASLKEISDMFMARPDMVKAIQPLIGFGEKAIFDRAATALQTTPTSATMMPGDRA